MVHRQKTGEPELSSVRSAISELASAGFVSLGAVANCLETSPRTLQRRLNRDGLTFRALVDQSRHEIAGVLLCDTDLKVQQIAVRLGYGTPGAFARAFLRFSGRTPSAYRKACPEIGVSLWREMVRSDATACAIAVSNDNRSDDS